MIQNAYVKGGATSQIVSVDVLDSSKTDQSRLAGLAYNTANLVCYRRRAGAATWTVCALADMTLGTYTSLGFKEEDATNAPGQYQFCPENTSIAAAAPYVDYMFKGATNMAQTLLRVHISVAADMVAISGDSGAADNLEQYTDGTSQMLVDVFKISGDSAAANALEAVLDGTGGTITANITGNLSGSVGSVTSFGSLVNDIVVAIGSAATWGLNALHTLLTVTGIKLDDTYSNEPSDVAAATRTNLAAELAKIDAGIDASGTVYARNFVAAPSIDGLATSQNVTDAQTHIEAHGDTNWSSETLTDGMTITPATLGTDGDPLGVVMPFGHIIAYINDVIQDEFDADGDGDYSFVLPYGSVWTLKASNYGQYATTSTEVSTVEEVS